MWAFIDGEGGKIEASGWSWLAMRGSPTDSDEGASRMEDDDVGNWEREGARELPM